MNDRHSMIPDWQSNWAAFDDFASTLDAPFVGRYVQRRFDYIHPVRLQGGVPPRLRNAYPVSVAYTEWGPANASGVPGTSENPTHPLVLCVGGVANSAHRFHFLAADLSRDHRVICLDWLGRGLSGWMADQSEYGLETCVEQLRQTIAHLGIENITIIGSSLGGTAATVLAARYPRLVGRLILNDTGPYIPAGRRRRRAETLARHYVFRTPADMIRKVGVSQRNDGPISEDVRLYNTYHQTRWCDTEAGRIYRHDPRALMAYREEACHNVNIWHEWYRAQQPMLVLHGMLSDALLLPTLRRMSRRSNVSIIHIPDTGHTPVLNDPNHIHFIRSWIDDPQSLGTPITALHSQIHD